MLGFARFSLAYRLLACFLPCPTASAYPRNDHFWLSPAGLNRLTDAAFSTIAYKDNQCLRGFQGFQQVFSFLLITHVRLEPQGMQRFFYAVLKFFFWCSYFVDLTRVSEGHIFECPVNTGVLEGFLNFHWNNHLPISLPPFNGTTAVSIHVSTIHETTARGSHPRQHDNLRL